MDLEDIQRHIDKVMHEQNNQGNPDFEGYSPFEMHQILNFTFNLNSPIGLKKLSDTDYQKIPMLNQIKYLINLIDKVGEIKLTNKGFLPTKIVSELYQQGFLKDDHIEKNISKLYKETDSMTINLTRILIELAGLTKKRHGKISLTKSSKKILADNYELFRLIFLTFANKFNWAYYDGYGDNQIGQLGFGFSLILLSKYGYEKRLDSFYAGKYLSAFPMLIEQIESSRFDTKEEQSSKCYSLRTFDRFLEYFGLIEIDSENKWDSDKFIKKTELFDKLIKVRPHNKVYKS